MAKKLVMPKLGLTMKEGKIIQWYKAEGDSVSPGETLYRIETDKLTNDVEATDSGILRKILVGENQKAPCLATVAVIGDADEDISHLLVEAAASEEPVVEKVVAAKKPVKKKPMAGGRVRISPVARRLAEENDLDYSVIEGTGPGGRIVLKDVEEAIERRASIKASPAAAKLAEELGIELASFEYDQRMMKEDLVRHAKEDYYKKLAEAQDERVEMTTMRRIISERMSYSDQLAPTVNFVIPVNMEKMKKLRDDIKEDTRVTYTDLIIKITSQLLLEHPLLNSSIDGEEIVTRNYVNMGVAVALEDGLLVPVIKNAHLKGLREISKELKDLSYRAKSNQLSTDEIAGGTFTITNIGMFGIESFTPIINQPESAILGVNAIIDTPVVEDGQVLVKPIMKLSLTADHRNVDGAVAAHFLAQLKQALENPLSVLL